MNKAPFKKGQLVYHAKSYFGTVATDATRGDIRIGVVIERLVDSCGVKKVTFADRGGLDDVFGKSQYFSCGTQFIFATAEGAFAALKSDVICPDVYSDDTRKVFIDFADGVLRIAANPNN